MPRKSLIGERELNAIAQAFNQNRAAKAEAIRDIASKISGRELGLSTVQRQLAMLRKNHPKGSTDPLDNQWSLASLKDYPIDAKAIPFLLYIQESFAANAPEEVKAIAREEGLPMPFLTNRLAIWISRLLQVPMMVETLPTKPPPITIRPNGKPGANQPGLKWVEVVDDLVHIAMWYANFEIGCELVGVKPNTAMFDAPTLDQIKVKIATYNKPILKKHGIRTGQEPDKFERMKSMTVEEIARRGERK